MRERRCSIRSWVPLVLCCFALAAAAQPRAAAGTLDWPDGCTIKPESLPEGLRNFIQRGLNVIFLDACNEHDLCYGECNSGYEPYFGVGHRIGCDAAFGARLEGACILWAGLLSYPVDDSIVSPEDFIRYCNGVLAPALTVVVAAVGADAYENDQCARGCNTNYCKNGRIKPKSCGCPSFEYTGQSCPDDPSALKVPLPNAHGVCWFDYNPPPSPPLPTPVFCPFFDCCNSECSLQKEFCCGGCWFGCGFGSSSQEPGPWGPGGPGPGVTYPGGSGTGGTYPGVWGPGGPPLSEPELHP